MLSRTYRAGIPALAAGALAIGALTPAGAAAKPSLANVKHDVKVANAQLGQVRRLAHHHRFAAAEKALARTRAAATEAAHQARWLHATSDSQTAAEAFMLVEAQYGNDVQSLTGLLGTVTGSLQTKIASALAPALAGQTQALGFLGSLAPQLPAPSAGAVTGLIGNILGGAPAELQALESELGSGTVPAPVQAAVGQAVTTADGVLDAMLAQLEALVPQLPAQAQPAAQQMLTQLTSVFTQVKTLLGQVEQLVGGDLGSKFTGELGQVTGLLEGLLGNLTGLIPSATGTGSAAGTVGSATGTGGGSLASIPLPPFIQGLVGQLGLPISL
jgi:hypothetical protein